MNDKFESGHEMQHGDIVRLNSGSPDLRVVSMNGDKITVEWLAQLELPSVCFQRV